MRKICYLLFVLLLASASATLVAWAQDSAAPPSPHEVEVLAKTFEFVPNEIHVKAGERVAITLRSADRAHGLQLDVYPEGASENGNPGMVFDRPQDEAKKVDKHQQRVILFLAARPGTYDFKCSVKCSMGHGHDRMTGKLIVDE